MLYFSRVEIDPERIDVQQIEKLKSFKEKAYPEGLIENYRRVIEFRDKFARQLELKIRDLQRNETMGSVPLSLEFFSVEAGDLLGRRIEQLVDYPEVTDLDSVPEAAKASLIETIKESTYCPVVLAIRNVSSSGIRNIFAELHLQADNPSLELVNSFSGRLSNWKFSRPWAEALTSTTLVWDLPSSETQDKVNKAIARFETHGLQRDTVNGGWRFSFEWDALQPQRLRLVQPVLYASSKEAALLSITARIYSDTFPEPFALDAALMLSPQVRHTELKTLIPDWEDRIKQAGSVKLSEQVFQYARRIDEST